MPLTGKSRSIPSRLDPPQPSRKFARVKVSSSELQPRCRIIRLPKQTNLENLSDGSCQFQLHHLLVKVISSTQQVTSVDFKSDRNISLKINPCQICFDIITITSQSDRALFLMKSEITIKLPWETMLLTLLS
jgi:hypothetical protein